MLQAIPPNVWTKLEHYNVDVHHNAGHTVIVAYGDGPITTEPDVELHIRHHDEGGENMPADMPGAATGWNEHGHARKTGLPVDALLGSGDLQDAENCGYAPDIVLGKLGVDPAHGGMLAQFREGRIVLRDGTVLERGGTLGAVWAVTHLPGIEHP